MAKTFCSVCCLFLEFRLSIAKCWLVGEQYRKKTKTYCMFQLGDSQQSTVNIKAIQGTCLPSPNGELVQSLNAHFPARMGGRFTEFICCLYLSI